MNKGIRHRLTSKKAALIAAALALAVSIPGVRNDFVMEEKNTTIVENQEIRSLANIPGFFAGPWTPKGLGSNYYRPIPTSLFAVEYAIFGLNPAGWHLVSALIYSAAAFLTALLLARLTRSATAALIGGALFAVLPAHVEPFGSVNYQTVLTMGLFTACAFLAFGRILEQGLKAKSLIQFALCAAAAMMSKEEAYVLPVLALSWALLERRAGMLRSAVASLVVLAPIVAFLLFVRSRCVDPIEQTFFLPDSPAGEMVMTMLRAAVLYAEILVFPIRLSPFYEWFIVPYESTVSFNVALGAVLVASVAISVYLAAKKGMNAAAIGLSWLLLGLLPVSQVIQFVVVAADRFLYLPSIGWCSAVGSIVARLLSHLTGKRRSMAIGLVVLALAAYSVRTLYRVGDWKDDYTLNRAVVRDFPQTPVPHINLANLYLADDDLESAKRSVEEAIRLAPKWEIAEKMSERIEQERSKGPKKERDRVPGGM